MKISSKFVGVFLVGLIGNCLANNSDSDGESRGGNGDSNSIRFNKFEPDKPNNQQIKKILPLRKNDYPISADRNSRVSNILKSKTNAASVVNEAKDYEVKYSVPRLIELIGGEPDHPASNNTAPYWGKLREVIKMRQKNDTQPGSTELSDVMQLPLRWKNFTVYDIGEAVHDEYPSLHQAEYIEDLIGLGKYGQIEFDNKALKQRSGTRFLRGIIALADLHTWSVGVVAPHNFGAKWYAGRARPEEVAYKVSTGEIKEEYVPVDIFTAIKDMGLTKATDFTQYPEGSPMHPSWPAMHSAASNISFWLQVIMNLTPRQLCEAKKVDYAVAFARTIAGVHYPDDNIAGLNMGQEIVTRALPAHLDIKYDSNKQYIKKKVQEKRFDWREYDPLKDCNIITMS